MRYLKLLGSQSGHYYFIRIMYCVHKMWCWEDCSRGWQGWYINMVYVWPGWRGTDSVSVSWYCVRKGCYDAVGLPQRQPTRLVSMYMSYKMLFYYAFTISYKMLSLSRYSCSNNEGLTGNDSQGTVWLQSAWTMWNWFIAFLNVRFECGLDWI